MFDEISKLLFAQHGYSGEPWAMSMAERCAMACLLSYRRAATAIEVGTLGGGSLAINSHYSGKVYSVDIDTQPSVALSGRFGNVEFVTGDSRVELPRLIDRITREGGDLGFVLIDGDHSFEGVKSDIEQVLKYSPKSELLVLMHDSFNPDCREAMKSVDWEGNPLVHWIDYDFVPGFLNSVPGWEDQMWGGFALAVVRPEERKGALSKDELLVRQFSKMRPISAHG